MYPFAMLSALKESSTGCALFPRELMIISVSNADLANTLNFIPFLFGYFSYIHFCSYVNFFSLCRDCHLRNIVIFKLVL